MSLAALCYLALGKAQLPEPVLLRIRPAANTRTAYRMRLKLQAAGQPGELDCLFTVVERLKSVSGTSQRWAVSSNIDSVKSPGAYAQLAESIKDTLDMDYETVRNDRGHLLKTIAYGMEMAGEDTSNLVFPQQAVQLGDSWKATVTSNGQRLQVRYTLTDFLSENGKKLAVVKGYYDAGQIVKNLKPLEFVVDIKSGLTMRGSGAIEATISGFTMKTSYEMKRLWTKP